MVLGTKACRLRVVLLMWAFSGAAQAQRLEIDAAPVTSRQTLAATLRLPAALRGPARLRLTWSDSYGRIEYTDAPPGGVPRYYRAIPIASP